MSVETEIEKAEHRRDWPSIHKTAIERFKLANEAETEQRKRELDDLRFAARDHWPAEIKKLREADANLGIQARPMLSIDLLRQPIQQLENQQRQARLGVTVNPKGGKASKKTAEMLQGLYRNIEQESRANIARGWAYSRAIKCGRGAYRIRTDYANDGDFDQDIIIERILNQASVYLDPSAQQPDWSDGQWALIVSDMPLSTFKREFPGSKVSSMNESELTALGNEVPGWCSFDGVARTVRVAEYFYVEPTTRTIAAPDGKRTRTITERKVCWVKMTAAEVLAKQDWPGRYIPIIPVIANEENIDGKRQWEGIVGPAKESNRVFDYETSQLVEQTALSTKAPWIIAEGQVEGYERFWQQANVRPFSYLTYKPTTVQGALAPPPQRNVAEPPIAALVQTIAQMKANVDAQLGAFEPSRGNLSSGERSGKALLALQKKSEEGNSGYLQTLADVSMTYEGKVILDLIPHIYDTPGRVVRILGVDEQPSSVIINAPFLPTGPDGEPQPIPEGEQPPPEALLYDLREGQYTVTVGVGKSYATMRQESAEMIGAVIQAEPQLLTIIGDIWMRAQDFPEAEDIADRLEKLLPPQLQEGNQAIPPEAQAQIAQLTQQVQELSQLADKNKADLMKAQMETESRERIEAAKLEAQQQRDAFQAQADQMKAQADMQIAQIKLQIEEMKLVAAQHQQHVDLQAQHEQAEHDRQHDAAMTVVGQQHERETSAVQRDHEARMAAEQPKSA